jgi:ferric-dicitrate binding protein FerR (iron transport regulator)
MKIISEAIKTGALLGKYLTGKETQKESEYFNEWLNKDIQNRKLFNSINKETEIAGSMEQYESIDKDRAWERYISGVKNLALEKSLFRWKIAASILLVAALAGMLFYYLETSPKIFGDKDMMSTQIATEYGQSSKISLPDGSVVWLNSGTKLSYDNQFAIRNRDIIMTGQAFFQISRNENLPLVVSCNDLKVKVTGTKFDVSAYSDENEVSVVLESGSVLLALGGDNYAQQLKPGQMAEYNKQSKKLVINNIDPQKSSVWRNGILVFENDPMDEVIRKLERRYNIDIVVSDPAVYNSIFTATIKNQSLEEIFKSIKFSCSVNYTIINDPAQVSKTKIILYN